MVEYALNDVRYILPLADHFTSRLRTLGRAPHTHLLASVAEVPELFGIANG